MTAHDLVLLAVNASIMLMVFGTGLNARWSDALYLLRRPKELARSIVAMNILMPAVALALCATFNLHPAVKIALVALAVSPVPPFLLTKQLKAGGNAAYVIGLLTATSLFAILLVPATMALLGNVFHRELGMPVAVTVKIMLSTVLVPLALGILIRLKMPHLARRIEQPVMWIAAILLVGGIVPLTIAVWPQIVSLIGNGTLAVITAFTIIGLAVGYALGGPNADDRMALALATSARHPAVAIAIAHVNFPEQHDAIAAVLLALIVSAAVSGIYLLWRKKYSIVTPHHARGM